MEFGLFMGGFIHEDLMAADPDAEHHRLMSEVDLAVVGDRPTGSTRGGPSTTSSGSTPTSRPTRRSCRSSRRRPTACTSARGIINITPPVNHPARVAERVAMMDHLSGGRFEFGTGTRLVHHGTGRVRDHRPRDHQGHVRRGHRRVQVHVARRHLLPRRRSSSLSRSATCCPSPTSSRTRRCGSRPATRARSRRRGRWASACCASPADRPRRWSPVDIYKEAIKDADPVGEFVNDNVAITTSFMCLEDDDAAIDWATQSGNGRQQSLVFRTSTRSRSRRGCRNGRS